MVLTTLTALLIFTSLCSTSTFACKFLSSEDKPKGLEERALDSEVVLAAYTRAVFKDLLFNSATNYSAEFLVFNILKGEEVVSGIFQKRKPSSLETALNRRLVNASSFGDPAKCQSDVSPGETYILYLDVVSPEDELAARYDGVYGPAVLYSKDKELALEAIGARPWSDWSPCSGSCGGGIQQRKRQCDSIKNCDNEEGEQRACNMFSCTEILNILEESFRPNPPSVPPRRQLPSGSWRSKHEDILFPRTFPWEFSLLVTVRARPSSSGGFLLRVLHSAALQVGLYMSDSLTLVLSDKDGIRVSFVKALADGDWHQVAFSVRRNTVSFYLDCEHSSKLPVPGKIRPFGGQLTTVIIGSTGMAELDVFQGEIGQLIITGSPDAAERQCNATTEPLNFRSRDVARREEIWSRTFTSGTQNDQLPLRGDIIDDEDFGFMETGSGQGGNEEDYNYEDDKSSEIQKNGKEKEKIPLKEEPSVSSNEVISSDEESDEDDSENDKDHDYHPDEEPDDDESLDDGEGSGKDPDFELAWSEWSPCSSTCNWGRRTRTSYCLDNGVNMEACVAASSRRSETETCFVRLCPTAATSTPAPSVSLAKVPVKKVKCEVECLNGASCDAPRSCRCAPGFHGSQCQFVKQMCKINCRNGGTCKPPATCLCQQGFFGNECQYGCGQPCKKGNHCLYERSCKCPPGYMPPTCTPVCKPSCLNGGACVAPNKCRCKPGYVGKSCQRAICEQGCKNGGECVAPNRCACRSGYAGKDCSQPLCEPRCQNGGECVKPYFCHCPPGAKGAFCEKLLCKPECRNGGTCIGPGKCSCLKGYSGYLCEKADCLGSCKNGGKCTKTGKCSCLSGYTGLNCEIRKPCKFTEVKEPYKRGYKQKVTTQVKVPCGAWDWKQCTKTKVHYEMVYKTFFRTIYKCEDVANAYHLAYPKHSKRQLT